jgi:hypothetical protein
VPQASSPVVRARLSAEMSKLKCAAPQLHRRHAGAADADAVAQCNALQPGSGACTVTRSTALPDLPRRDFRNAANGRDQTREHGVRVEG